MSIRWGHSAALVLLFVSLPASAFAGVTFSEIMYDLPGADEGREWIEIENPSDVPLDISGWRLAESGTNHKLKASGASVIPARGFAVIADDADAFRADWPGFAGLLFESAFAFNNTGEEIHLKDASLATVATVTYLSSSGAKGDGNSLNEVGGSWKPRKPSPGFPANADAFVPERKTATASPGNLTDAREVREKYPQEAAPGFKSEDHLAATAVAMSEDAPNRTDSFGMLPWIGVLVLISGLGFAAALMGRPKNRSGYHIIEEET